MNEDPAAMLARLAELLAHQQGEMTTLMRHQAQLMEALKPREREKRVEGISMPTYHGKMGESLQVFLQQVKLYFDAKNINTDETENQGRLIAMVASNLKGQAAAWYTFHEGKFTVLNELLPALQREFVPPDLQERLRTELFSLKQIHCDNLEDYVARFRHII